MNRIDKVFKEKQWNILSVYYTAGYPSLDSTVKILHALEDAGADMVEIGIPFSDPIADGPVIQHSDEISLKNGMNMSLLFSQLRDIRKSIQIPILLMGYFNPVLQYGVDKFCRDCMECGIDGLILPDLPPEVYVREYSGMFEKYDINNILLIAPQSSDQRIQMIDKISRGFNYVVSSSAVTGVRGKFAKVQLSYFKRVRELKLENPTLIGFGISDHDTFTDACRYSNGGIIGSAFINLLGQKGESADEIKMFIRNIRD